ncbi:unnamed protein product, partial [Rotaria sp. Silwood1]
MSDFYFGCIIL